jgi:quinol monooxygenase YgiN
VRSRDLHERSPAAFGSVSTSCRGASGTIVGIEQWASAADHDRHLAGAHFQRLAGRMADLIAEPPGILTYTVIDE